MTGVFDGSIGTKMKCCVYHCVVLLFLLTVRAAKKESCERCVPADSCPFYTNMKNEDQTNWQNRFKCEVASSSKPVYGFSSSAKGDLVCCPENIWQVDDQSHLQQNGESSTQQTVKMEKNSFLYPTNYNAPNYFGYPSGSTSTQLQGYPNGGSDGNGNPGNTGSGITGNQYGNTNGNQRSDKGYQVYENDNENGGANGDHFGSQANDNKNSASPDNQGNQNADEGYDNGDDDESDNSDYDSQRSPWSGRRRGKRPNNVQNPYFLPANRNDNSFGGTKPAVAEGGQCPVTSFPPDPNTGCCGQEATNPDRISASPNNANANPRYTDTQSSWQPHAYGYRPSWLPFSDKVKREADVNITFDNRIAGGKETELEQFPWTVLLKTVFQYPDKDVAFSCGGSLISSRYVLTAGHCVFDNQGTIKDVEINLAEYDKRTFPEDCKNVLGRGQVCVENIVMHAEKVHLHPEYDDNRLQNDIALIRLRGDAPYTDYIRPICLPPINVDSPQLSNLRLAVAGWGRNGQYKSNIKQSTVVNLVPYSDCINSYPSLTRLQLCAAGYTGEDTCKGDSGGPLMMLYGGKYFVSGVVSGKRADAPCGTSVPSLYTNVYEYQPWIRRVINN